MSIFCRRPIFVKSKPLVSGPEGQIYLVNSLGCGNLVVDTLELPRTIISRSILIIYKSVHVRQRPTYGRLVETLEN